MHLYAHGEHPSKWSTWQLAIVSSCDPVKYIFENITTPILMKGKLFRSELSAEKRLGDIHKERDIIELWALHISTVIILKKPKRMPHYHDQFIWRSFFICFVIISCKF